MNDPLRQDEGGEILSAKSGSKTGLLVALAVVVTALVVGLGVYAWQRVASEREMSELRDEVEVLRGQVEKSAEDDSRANVLQWDKSMVSLDGKMVLHIDDFPDNVEVSSDAAFGSADDITGALLSPDEQWVAISVSGSAHGFGWLYNINSQELRPVVFQYGGSVELIEWNDNSEEISFLVITPEPAEKQVVIDINNLPEYPNIVSSDDRILLEPRIFEGQPTNVYHVGADKFTEDINPTLPPTTTVSYVSEEKGIRLAIPYNPAWGGGQFRIRPYEENNNGLFFGPLEFCDGPATGYCRFDSLVINPVKKADVLIQELKSQPLFDSIKGINPIRKTVKGLEVVEYIDSGFIDVSTVVVIGNKNNYIFRTGGNDGFKYLESIVVSLEFI